MPFNKNEVYTVLGAEGYTGQINEREIKFLADNGYKGQLNDEWYNYLKSQGYPGTLTDKFHAWASDGYTVAKIIDSYYNDVVTLFRMQESESTTTGSDDGPNGFNWTGVGNAQITSGALNLDGTGDYLTLASDAHDWNFFTTGASWTFEVWFDEWPTDTNNAIFETTGASSTNIGAWIDVRADGTVRIYVTRGVNGSELIDTVFTTTPASGTNHLVIEHLRGDESTLNNRVCLGLNGSLVSRNPAKYGYAEILDSTYDALIGSVNGTGVHDAACNILGYRVTKHSNRYDLHNQSTYIYIAAPDELGTAAPSGIREFQPRYWPDEGQPAAGYTLGKYYQSEPRFINLGGGEILMFHTVGNQHASTTNYDVYTLKSTDYGQSFPESSRITVATDATYAARNMGVSQDSSSGRITCFYRTANASNVTQGNYFKTSTDGGDTWSSATDITSTLTSGVVPFGKAVNTSNGLMQVFYDGDFAEALFSTDNGQTWGSRTTIYDTTGSPLGYNEPYPIAITDDNIVIGSRRDATGNNDFVFFKSTDGGSTWDSGTEGQWTATAIGSATPLCMALVGTDVITSWGARSPFRNIYYTKTAASDFFTTPTRAIDGTEIQVLHHSMPYDASWLLVSNAEYGYPDQINLGDGKVLMAWYEALYNSNTLTRIWGDVFTP